jgi:hypothetical protein
VEVDIGLVLDVKVFAARGALDVSTCAVLLLRGPLLMLLDVLAIAVVESEVVADGVGTGVVVVMLLDVVGAGVLLLLDVVGAGVVVVVIVDVVGAGVVLLLDVVGAGVVVVVVDVVGAGVLLLLDVVGAGVVTACHIKTAKSHDNDKQSHTSSSFNVLALRLVLACGVCGHDEGPWWVRCCRRRRCRSNSACSYSYQYFR